MRLLPQDAAGQPQEQVTDINRHGPLDYFLVKMQGKDHPFENCDNT
jgi:hypothetical protein